MPLTDTTIADLRGKVRDRDRDTSWTAAAKLTRKGELIVKDAILHILRAHGPLTHDEIWAYYREAGGRRTVNRIRTATHELLLAGFVVESNVMGLSFNGGDSHKWEVKS